MRITNTIMTNNTIRNVNTNKTTLDTLFTQLSTGKKIQRASENPIIAIRALRFRSELSELNQYWKKNIPDARSWMTLTEDALESVKGMVGSMITYMDQGANGTMDTEAKKAIITTLEQFRAQIHKDADATFSGRSIFTGYKTNSTMTFTDSDTTIQYDIKETFTPEDLDQVTTITNSVDISPITAISDAQMPVQHKTYRLRLSYDKLEVGNPEIAYKKTDATGNIVPGTIPVTALVCEGGKYYKAEIGPDNKVVYDADGKPQKANNTEVFPYKEMEQDTSTTAKAYLLADKGEIVMNTAAYTTLRKSDSFETDYTKIGFEKGELRPENYFSCTCTTNDGVKKVTEYSSDRQDINYTVNFNQTLKVNTEGRDVFSHDIVRDVDELVDITQTVLDLEAKVTELKEMEEKATGADKEKISSMLAAANKELDYGNAKLKSMYGAAITSFTKYQNTVISELSDIGSRCTRLTLNETRLSNQNTSLEDLKSVNEDADEAETIIHLTTAHNVYEASLSAASKLIATSLLDYI